jgi:hypothetical protein
MLAEQSHPPHFVWLPWRPDGPEDIVNLILATKPC